MNTLHESQYLYTMKIFSAKQIQAWDEYTIAHEPITSIDLMERAAHALAQWMAQQVAAHKTLCIFCGPGNNGGDGLALTRLLQGQFADIQIYIISNKRSADCQTNWERLQAMGVSIKEMITALDFPALSLDAVAIDALFGTGLNKPLEGLADALAQHLNASGATIIGIDLPSGLLADGPTTGAVVKATHTLSFQCPKLAFMLADNAAYVGKVHILDIGLHLTYYIDTATTLQTVDALLAKSLYRPRQAFGHKYHFGHALLYAGSSDMMGAAILSAKACLRSGAGLVTVHTEAALKHIVQTALPEALVSDEASFSTITDKKAAIGIGPGLATNAYNGRLLQQLLTDWEGPLVIDASALGLLLDCLPLLADKKGMPPILTPHGGEFKKLFGESPNGFAQIDTALAMAQAHHCFIVLKGHHTLIACPDGTGYFNTTGNSGMATAGSGDVLTGIITGLLAQGYTAPSACLLGVYLHGRAGDLAAAASSKEAMLAGDITEQLGRAFTTFY
jgi:ADP-dependent NAD(P)H-hydrate dehydratase / NAD(P)H-hydrate epimerase